MPSLELRSIYYWILKKNPSSILYLEYSKTMLLILPYVQQDIDTKIPQGYFSKWKNFLTWYHTDNPCERTQMKNCWLKFPECEFMTTVKTPVVLTILFTSASQSWFNIRHLAIKSHTLKSHTLHNLGGNPLGFVDVWKELWN